MKPRPMIPWRGGKSKLAPLIISLLPEHVCYVEPFGGAGNVLFRKQPSRVEVWNDINGELANLFRIVRDQPERFLKHNRLALVSREEFNRLKSADPAALDPVARAWRFFYLVRNSFAARLNSISFGTTAGGPPHFNPLTAPDLIEACHKRLARAIIENMPWPHILDIYDRPHTFFYLDPPWLGNENDYGPNIFSRDDFAALAQKLASLKGLFLLSLNDTEETRSLFANFHIRPVTVRYTCSRKNSSFPGAELLISNYHLPQTLNSKDQTHGKCFTRNSTAHSAIRRTDSRPHGSRTRRQP